jgi:hypothetical protein
LFSWCDSSPDTNRLHANIPLIHLNVLEKIKIKIRLKKRKIVDL